MSPFRAVLKYTFDINFINIPFSIILAFISGPFWGLVSFISFGILVGFFGFEFFKKNEYYLYYNLGFNKKTLFTYVFLINCSISVIMALVALLINHLL